MGPITSITLQVQVGHRFNGLSEKIISKDLQSTIAGDHYFSGRLDLQEKYMEIWCTPPFESMNNDLTCRN